MEIPAAIRQYSMAVAPDSLFKKRETMVFISLLLRPMHGSLTATLLCRTARSVQDALNETQDKR
jgi:hypothetical protein